MRVVSSHEALFGYTLLPHEQVAALGRIGMPMVCRLDEALGVYTPTWALELQRAWPGSQSDMLLARAFGVGCRTEDPHEFVRAVLVAFRLGGPEHMRALIVQEDQRIKSRRVPAVVSGG